MRIINAIKSDALFQLKQGFILVYIIITAMYLIVLSLLPESTLGIALPIVVFTDPSVLGLFFIGGIIMLEKEQGVIDLLVVSPLRTSEYILSKLFSLTFVSIIAAFALTLLSSFRGANLPLLFISVLLTSGIFTLAGIIINAGCVTVNQYLIKTIPYMLLLVLPCFSLIGFEYSYIFTAIPSVAALRLMLGAYSAISLVEAVALIIYLGIANYLLFRYAIKVFDMKIARKN